MPDVVLAELDGLLITGSPSNVEPHHYGGPAPRPDCPRDPARDATTLPLIRRALELAVPLFAICRGLQELNVALGGTLHQNVHELPGRADHRSDKTVPLAGALRPRPSGAAGAGRHGAGAAGWRRRRFRSTRCMRQAIDRLADRLAVEAIAPDGTIEAVRVVDAPGFALAVQWHPSGGCSRTPYRAACSPRSARPAGRARELAMSDMERWLRERRVTEVECLVADLNGIARGKILPTDKFIRSLAEDTLRLPEMIFVQTVTGDYPDEDRVTDPAVRDVRMRPDPRSLRIVPWYEEPTAQVISDCRHHDGSEVTIAPAAGPAPDPGRLCRARLAAGGRARARVLPDQDQRGSRLSAGAADRPLQAAGVRRARATASRRSTSSIRSSRTSTTGARLRRSTSTP